jgi:hypothetical protein
LQKDDLRRFGDKQLTPAGQQQQQQQTAGKQLTPAGQQQQQQTAGRAGLVLGAILENSTELNNGHAAGGGGRKRSQGATETGGVRNDRDFLGMGYFLNTNLSNLG